MEVEDPYNDQTVLFIFIILETAAPKLVNTHNALATAGTFSLKPSHPWNFTSLQTIRNYTSLQTFMELHLSSDLHGTSPLLKPPWNFTPLQTSIEPHLSSYLHGIHLSSDLLGTSPLFTSHHTFMEFTSLQTFLELHLSSPLFRPS